MSIHTAEVGPSAGPAVIRHVMVAVDFSEASRDALALAASLARRLGANLSVVHVVADPCHERWASEVDVELGDLTERCVREAEGRLRGFVANLGPDRVRTAVRLGDAPDELLRFAAEIDADLIVIGRQGAAAPSPGRMGAVVSRVLESAPCPVITTPAPEEARMLAPSPRPHPAPDAATIRGILAASDFSQVSNAAVDYARQLGAQLHCPVHVLHVAASASADRSGLEPDSLVRVGDPATEVLRCAGELGDDLIVLGTRGRGAVGRSLLGSVARDVVARATGPTFTVTPSGARRGFRGSDGRPGAPSPETTTGANATTRT